MRRRHRFLAERRAERIVEETRLAMPISPANYITLSAMITPALFMTANGSLIISTSNRMSRIVDRIRVLNDLSDSLCRGVGGLDYPTERRAHVSDQLRLLGWRSDHIRFALTALYLAFASFVGTSLSLAADVLLSNRLVAVPTGLAVVGVCLLLFASVKLVSEARVALSSTRMEISFFRDLQSLREREGGCVVSDPESSGNPIERPVIHGTIHPDSWRNNNWPRAISSPKIEV